MPGEEKKRRGRGAYLEDFRQTASGKYVYNGEMYHFVEQGMTRSQALGILWILAAGMLAAGAAAGCVPAAGMVNCGYVIIPYAGSLVAVGSVVWAMCRLSAGGDPLRDYVYRATVGQLKARGILVLTLSGGTLLGEGIYLIRHGAGNMLPGTASFLIFETLLLALGFVWKSVLIRLKWSK